uniref:C3H1-type domain-containing protein n=1 Tax=Steinernema glaseri TaxID=37863 RepID=A0A1I8A9F1_9BILA
MEQDNPLKRHEIEQLLGILCRISDNPENARFSFFEEVRALTDFLQERQRQLINDNVLDDDTLKDYMEHVVQEIASRSCSTLPTVAHSPPVSEAESDRDLAQELDALRKELSSPDYTSDSFSSSDDELDSSTMEKLYQLYHRPNKSPQECSVSEDGDSPERVHRSSYSRSMSKFSPRLNPVLEEVSSVEDSLYSGSLSSHSSDIRGNGPFERIEVHPNLVRQDPYAQSAPLPTRQRTVPSLWIQVDVINKAMGFNFDEDRLGLEQYGDIQTLVVPKGTQRAEGPLRDLTQLTCTEMNDFLADLVIELTNDPEGHIAPDIMAEARKTKICKYWSFSGHCFYRTQCNFAHGEEEASRLDPAKNNLYRTVLCRNYMTGKCAFGDRCSYAHGVENLRQRTDNWSGASNPVREEPYVQPAPLPAKKRTVPSFWIQVDVINKAMGFNFEEDRLGLEQYGDFQTLVVPKGTQRAEGPLRDLSQLTCTEMNDFLADLVIELTNDPEGHIAPESMAIWSLKIHPIIVRLGGMQAIVVETANVEYIVIARGRTHDLPSDSVSHCQCAIRALDVVGIDRYMTFQCIAFCPTFLHLLLVSSWTSGADESVNLPFLWDKNFFYFIVESGPVEPTSRHHCFGIRPSYGFAPKDFPSIFP